MASASAVNDGYSLLYLEDEAEARELIGRMLARKYPGMELHIGKNGAEGLALYQAHRPDIIVTDIRMPVMDGIRMATEIKALEPEALIIAVTAHSDTQYLLNAIEIGINQYVLKPIDSNKLFAAIDRCSSEVALKRQLELQNRRISKLSRAVEENPCSIVITDREGTISYVNPAFTNLTGYSSEEAIGQNPRVLKSGHVPAATYENLWSTITAGRQWRGEFLNRKKSGDFYWESASISPIFNDQGEITSFVAVKEDITERKQAEERIEVLNTRLAARAAELEVANQDLEAFSYTVSHDLRKPLTNISCYCQVIQEIFGPRLEQECRDYVRDILAETLRMNQLIETILTFSRLSRNPLHPGPVNLSDIVAKVTARLSRGEPERQHEFRIAGGMVAEGDYKLLQVAIENLLGNAWKYTGSRKKAVIEFGAMEAGDETTYFVRDNGIGFDMANADKLFIPFERLHGSAEFEGHGIGLATVHRIIQRHGGRIWAEGKEGTGATFWFTLPADRDAQAT
jgi:PAS domain S-box-containing protein